MGPFHNNPFSSKTVYSPLSTVEKKDSVDRRIVMDLSFPPAGKSVNDIINPSNYLEEASQLKYPSVNDLVELVKNKGKGYALMKHD